MRCWRGGQAGRKSGVKRAKPHSSLGSTVGPMTGAPKGKWKRSSFWRATTLAVATLRPSEQSILLMAAILCALPWSLALLLLDLSQGFADRAAVIVTLGLFANVALIGGSRSS